MESRRKTLLVCCLAPALLGVGGCYTEIDPAEPQASQEPRPQPQDPVDQQVSAGGGSALGGAKRSAQNVVSRVEQRSKELADEFDPYDND